MLLIGLLVTYQIKHFICDYPLQNEYMLGKFKPKSWVTPLLAHVSVHGVATFIIASLFTTPLIGLGLALFDMIIHFIMDRIKASPKLLGRYKSLSPGQYNMAKNMSHGLGAIDGKPLPHELEPETLEAYKNAGIKDLRGNKLFWWCLGLDQMVHHLTHYVIIIVILALQ